MKENKTNYIILMLMLINILITFFIILIFYQLFLAYFKNRDIEGMMAIIGPVITPKHNPTNRYYYNSNINQDFDPGSVTTFYS